MKFYLPRHRTLTIQSSALDEQGPLMQDISGILASRFLKVQEAIDAVVHSVENLDQALVALGFEDQKKLMDSIKYGIQKIETKILSIGIDVEVEDAD